MPTIFSRIKTTPPEKITISEKPDNLKAQNPSQPPQTKPSSEQQAIPTSLNMRSAYSKNPVNVRLKGQDPDETVLLFLRRHFVTNTPWILKSLFFAILPIFINPILQISQMSLGFVPIRIRILILTFYYFILLGYALASYLTWFYTIGLVTNKKAMDLDFNSLSSINVGSVNLPDTSDARFIQHGFFESFFDYGDIIITIEATKEKFTFEKTPKPSEVTDVISDLIRESSGPDKKI